MTKRSSASLIYSFAAVAAGTATAVYGIVAIRYHSFEPSWFLGCAAAAAVLLLLALDEVRWRRQTRATRERRRAARECRRRELAEAPTRPLPSYATYRVDRPSGDDRSALDRDWKLRTNDIRI